eukprot:TRINITY_DN34927_c0_g1_i1.p1 TRINITY_DN34927_c0_g1~~TRINITY_DN34927_c0_g1_i1.p1  ORF type:complete len:211 (-),score=-10.58 TRINITY_DN34927_c0_g1_i1:11-643(-)
MNIIIHQQIPTNTPYLYAPPYLKGYIKQADKRVELKPNRQQKKNEQGMQIGRSWKEATQHPPHTQKRFKRKQTLNQYKLQTNYLIYCYLLTTRLYTYLYTQSYPTSEIQMTYTTLPQKLQYYQRNEGTMISRPHYVCRTRRQKIKEKCKLSPILPKNDKCKDSRDQRQHFQTSKYMNQNKVTFGVSVQHGAHTSQYIKFVLCINKRQSTS